MSRFNIERSELKGRSTRHVGQAMKKWVIRSALGCVLGAVWLALTTTAGTAEPFFFIQLSDPQFGMFTGDKDFVQETVNFEFAAATVNRLRPKFVIITGDLVNKPGDAAQIAEYKRITGKIDRSIPVYHVAGNHDVENVPTPSRLTEYTNQFGPDRFTFRQGEFAGIVLNSSIIHSPQQTTNQLAEQEQWLREELKWIRHEQVKHVVVFQHHPWFLKAANEPDQYFNIPRERRTNYLALFHESGVKYLFSGHYHRNAIARDGDLEAITTGPVGQPQGDDKSGLRVVIVRDNGLEHRYFHFGEVPNRIDPKRPLNKTEK
jgi:serine/threonine-protein phosphatase CPPED1